MNRVNLVSNQRSIQLRTANCICRWVAGIAAWSACVTVACVGVLAVANIESDLESTRAAMVLRTATAQSTAATSRAQIDSMNKRLAVSRAVRRYPDWSILLPIVASELGEDIALDKISLEPIRGEQSTQRATLILSGVGTSRAAVSDFVIRLEATGTFARVETTSAQRRQIRDLEVFAFEVHCRIGNGWEVASP